MCVAYFAVFCLTRTRRLCALSIMLRNSADILASLLLLLAVLTSVTGEGEPPPPYGSLKKPPNYHDDDDENKCSPIREPVCQGLKYSETKMPNWVKMTSQEEAAKRMIDYNSLLNINCSHYLKLFLCSIYFPMCTPVLDKSALKPCKPLCLHVRNQCEPIMRRFQFNWPAELSCEELPELPKLCIEPDGYALDDQKPAIPPSPAAVPGGSLTSLQNMYPQLHDIIIKKSKDAPNLHYLLQAAVAAADSNKGCNGAEFSVSHFSNGTCLTHCGADLYYRPADKKFARAWILVWAVLCVVSSTLTFLTFVADSSRLRYPERPVLYLSACYFAIGVGYILQYGLGPERVTCRALQVNEGNPPEMQSYLLTGGQESTWCTVCFLISYYFSMASNLWWVMLSLAWYFSTSRKWGHEGVGSVSSIFHMFAWAVPAILSILILIQHKIDADELTGTCYTGFHSKTTLLFCVLLPQTVCLLLGLILLSVGFAAVLRVRRKLKTPIDRERESRRRLEKSIAKLGVLVVLYTCPMACLIASNLYEYLGQSGWRAAIQKLLPHCLSPRGVAWGVPDCHPESSPSSEAAMLRIFMSFVIGITSGMWVWGNKKTLASWKRALCRRERQRNGAAVASNPPAAKPERNYRTPVSGPSHLQLPQPTVVPDSSEVAAAVATSASGPGVYLTDANTIFSGSYSSSCQSCRMCPPPPPAPTELTAGGYSSGSGTTDMYREVCYLHQHPHEHNHFGGGYPAYQNGVPTAGQSLLNHRGPQGGCI